MSDVATCDSRGSDFLCSPNRGQPQRMLISFPAPVSSSSPPRLGRCIPCHTPQKTISPRSPRGSLLASKSSVPRFEKWPQRSPASSRRHSKARHDRTACLGDHDNPPKFIAVMFPGDVLAMPAAHDERSSPGMTECTIVFVYEVPAVVPHTYVCCNVGALSGGIPGGCRESRGYSRLRN